MGVVSTDESFPRRRRGVQEGRMQAVAMLVSAVQDLMDELKISPTTALDNRILGSVPISSPSGHLVLQTPEVRSVRLASACTVGLSCFEGGADCSPHVSKQPRAVASPADRLRSCFLRCPFRIAHGVIGGYRPECADRADRKKRRASRPESESSGSESNVTVAKISFFRCLTSGAEYR